MVIRRFTRGFDPVVSFPLGADFSPRFLIQVLAGGADVRDAITNEARDFWSASSAVVVWIDGLASVPAALLHHTESREQENTHLLERR